jgi:hypothetical protein
MGLTFEQLKHIREELLMHKEQEAPGMWGKAVIRGLLDLEERVAVIERKPLDIISSRVAALKQAREIIDGMPSEKPNTKGYRDQAMRPEVRIVEELRLARFLLGEEQ